MNTVLEIKTSLINRIKSTNDLIFLQAVQTIFDATEKNVFQLTDKQSKSIEISRKQIVSGEYKSNQTVLSELKKWLN